MIKTLDYLQGAKLMQVATVSGSKPWVCTVYFVADEKLNFYWLSWPSRRHSQEIAINSNVAITVVIKPDLPVIGIQAEGAAGIVKAAEVVEKIMKLYVNKYGTGKEFYENFKKGTNKHQLYKFTPSNLVLFDEQNFPNDPQHEIKI